MNGIYALFVGLCVAGAAARTTYEILKKQGKIDTSKAGSLFALLAAMSAFLASWIFMGAFDPARTFSSGPTRWVGLGMVLAGLALVAGGLFGLKRVENIDRLVTTGLFSRLRHPMYTGFVFWILGWVVFHGAITSVSIALIGIANIVYWRRLEERALESRYGEEFRRYRERTWF